MKNYRAKIKLSPKSRRAAISIHDALLPDLRRLPKTSSRTEIYLKNSDIVFTVETSDLASLRASINSYIRLADTSYKCITL